VKTARVLVTGVEVGVLNVAMATDPHQYVPTTWSARGVVLGTGDNVTWHQVTYSDPIPTLAQVIELDLEPDTWRVVR
jgi:hypothetical protein